ncbi:hypothetical protein [Actinokineospora inagensis]|uniref:hypothetical protein n=1 Tax=Actinokineospora inagensis TaxID=103730 RepID=UPI000414F080|nr:hypothetical protein [Actinokineospora inagensis]
MSESVEAVLAVAYDKALVRELLGTYKDAKDNFYLGKLRPTEVEGGRFCEAAYRILQQITTGTFTSLDDNLKTEEIANRLSRLREADHPKSVRIYLPRALRVVYDIRNSRDAAHLADGIDPNLQDSTLVIGVLDWVLAEFVRLSGHVSADVAQRLVDTLVTRKIPVVQEFGDVPKVLRRDLPASDHILALLYHCGDAGAPAGKLKQWLPEKMRANFRRTAASLDDRALVHVNEEVYRITRTGQARVESAGLLGPFPMQAAG